MIDTRICTCGHTFDLHQHYRVGADCSICGRANCSRPQTRRGENTEVFIKAWLFIIGMAAFLHVLYYLLGS